MYRTRNPENFQIFFPMPKRLSRAEESVILSTLGVRTIQSRIQTHTQILVNLVMLSSCKIKMPRQEMVLVYLKNYPQSRVSERETPKTSGKKQLCNCLNSSLGKHSIGQHNSLGPHVSP